MTKKLIAFDLDDTLSITKSPISDEMGELLVKLLDYYDVCVISGGRFEQIRMQVVDRLEATARQLTRLHIMPTCGTRYYRYDELEETWKKQYVNDLTAEQKTRIREALEASSKQLGLWPEKPYGEVIEDRLSQMTFSALGQQAPPEEKYAWDPDGKKKLAIRDLVAPLVSELEVRVGGTTSVDVTLIGVDKAYGMNKLLEEMNFGKEDILFIGDKLEEGGNDYPVRAMGIDTIAVERWEDTALVLEGILAVSA
ncbi:MAG: family hydrolase [Candidatus Saccharibacteria bacterium]|nr:family hydrolase [Candidatus Saccharibacteria bacterium]